MLVKNIAGVGSYIGSSNNEVSDGLEDKNPTGGAPCQKDIDCGGVDGGVCNLTTTHNITTGKCVCPKKRADVDCSYERKNGDVAGGLQFLCFLGVGVGNFILLRTGEAVGQLILLLAPFCACIGVCFVACGAASGSEEGIAVGGGVAVCIGVIICYAYLAGLIWCIIDGAMILQGEVLDGNGYLPCLGCKV